jgi:hypothetical protein
MIELSDISFVLSGGSTNALAIDSLGGEPSVTVVPTRLFNNIEPEDAEAGFTDYRCVYLANDNETDTLYHTIIFSDDEIADGASVELGMTFQNDVQQVAINDTVTSGGFDLLYEDQIFTVNYNASLSTWASNFQTAIRAITNLEDVTVTGSTSGTRTIFTVEFSGDAGNRYHELLVLDDNNLSPTVSISISKIANGSTFTGSIWTKKRNGLTFIYRETQIVNGRNCSVKFAEIFCFNTFHIAKSTISCEMRPAAHNGAHPLSRLEDTLGLPA